MTASPTPAGVQVPIQVQEKCRDEDFNKLRWNKEEKLKLRLSHKVSLRPVQRLAVSSVTSL